MPQKLKINVAGLVMNAFVDIDFPNILKFIKRFSSNDNSKDPEISVHFSKSTERNINISDNRKIITILGNDIDDLDDPFNLMGITQALFRFSAIHLAKIGTFLMHGSSAILDDKTICFGDNGCSTAKTLGSLEIAQTSGNYVADEFCFLNTKTGEIFGYSFIPIHVRNIVVEHLRLRHNLIMPETGYKITDAGYFIDPDKLFQLTSRKLDKLIYVEFSDNRDEIAKLSHDETTKAFRFCVIAHIAKLLHPELDRMQFASKTDSLDKKTIDNNDITEIANQIFSANIIEECSQRIPGYKIVVREPCSIVTLLRKQ